MSNFLDMLRDFTNFTGKIERDIHNAASRISLPDEIDLYNFFETWGGVAICFFRKWYTAMYSIRGFHKCKTLTDYLSIYDDCSQIKYYIGKNSYYAINFHGRGVFLVSEKRYNELKAYK